MITFECDRCDNSISKFFKKSKDIPKKLDCSCGGRLDRMLGAPSSKTTQVIDNGAMARKVELTNEVIEKERDRLNEE